MPLRVFFATCFHITIYILDTVFLSAAFCDGLRPRPLTVMVIALAAVAQKLRGLPMESVFDRLAGKLNAAGASFDVLRHAPVFTSEEAAAVRGTTLASGAKALVCKADEQFVLVVLPADRRLASKRVRKTASVKSLRFATKQEVEELTGLAPGSIPPFGSLFDLPTWCDEALAEPERINFNAGDHAISISLAYAEFVRVEQPRIGRFAE
jgi:Ala-tRNA(Pro) deacylase